MITHHRVKLQPHEGDNLGERIVTILCKRVYSATQDRPCEMSGCPRLRCTLKVSNKTRLLRSHEQLRCPAKNCPYSHWPTLWTPTISVELPTCREWTGKRSLFTKNQSNSSLVNDSVCQFALVWLRLKQPQKISLMWWCDVVYHWIASYVVVTKLTLLKFLLKINLCQTYALM